jgi:hypothetical protein
MQSQKDQALDQAFKQRLEEIMAGGMRTASLILLVRQEFIARCELTPGDGECRAKREAIFEQHFGDLHSAVVECERRVFEEYYLKSKYHPLYYVYRRTCKNLHAQEFYARNQKTSVLRPTAEEALAMRMGLAPAAEQ